MKDDDYSEFVDSLRDSSNIVDVIANYVPLKKRGRNFWGCCPFHHEKTPSFSVAPDKGFFYCFGCQAGGNVFGFLMKVENITFNEAVKLLAQKMNIPIPQRKKTLAETAKDQERKQLLRANELARDFFHACLVKTNYGQQAKQYLQSRGVATEIIEQFRLGFAPPGWNKLSSAFVERGFDSEVLIRSGLSIERPSGGTYDRFRNRIMFAICDEHGKVIGFGGRVIDDSMPKYLNSPETVVFNKKYILFGLHVAKNYIRELGQAIVMEGYMDAITAHAFGINNVVASLGTAFTAEQAKILLKHHAKEIIFAYDSDAAGQAATLRALAIASSMGAAVRVVAIPDGKDPDEFIRKHGAEAFHQLVSEAVSLLEYQINQAFLKTDASTLEGKVAIVNTLIPALSEANNAVETNTHIARLAQELGIDENAIRMELRKYLAANRKDKNANFGKNSSRLLLPKNQVTAVAQAERLLIRLMCEDAALIPYIEAQLPIDEFHSSLRRQIIELIYTAYHSEKTVIDWVSAQLTDQAAITELSHIMLMEFECAEIIKVVDGCIKTIHLDHLKISYEQHRLRADELERMGDSRFQQELAETQRIQYEINILSST